MNHTQPLRDQAQDLATTLQNIAARPAVPGPEEWSEIARYLARVARHIEDFWIVDLPPELGGTNFDRMMGSQIRQVRAGSDALYLPAEDPEAAPPDGAIYPVISRGRA